MSTEQEQNGKNWTGRILKEKRKAKGLTQANLALMISARTELPLSGDAVSKWERMGDSPINANVYNLKALVDILDNPSNGTIDQFTKFITQFGDLETKIDINGVYTSIWEYENNPNPETLVLRCLGSIVTGTVKKGEVDYELYGYLFTNRILMGFWINKYDSHMGTVMLKFDYDFEKAKGNWIGTSDKLSKEKKDIFRYGSWKIRRIE